MIFHGSLVNRSFVISRRLTAGRKGGHGECKSNFFRTALRRRLKTRFGRGYIPILRKKEYVKTHTTGSDRQSFPGTLGPEIQDVDEILRKMRTRWAIGI